MAHADPRLPYPASSVLPQEQTTATHSPPMAPSVWPCLEPAACRLCGPLQERLLPSGVPRSAEAAAADRAPLLPQDHRLSLEETSPGFATLASSPPSPTALWTHIPKPRSLRTLFLVFFLLLTPVLGTIPGAFETHPLNLCTPDLPMLPSPFLATGSLEVRPNDMDQHYHHIFASLPNSPSVARTRTPRPRSTTSCLPHICPQHS